MLTDESCTVELDQVLLEGMGDAFEDYTARLVRRRELQISLPFQSGHSFIAKPVLWKHPSNSLFQNFPATPFFEHFIHRHLL